MLVQPPIEVRQLIANMEWTETDAGDFTNYLQRSDAAYRELVNKYKVAQCGVADGCAVYALISAKPLRFFHVPYGDAWHAPEPWIRGLRASDFKDISNGVFR